MQRRYSLAIHVKRLRKMLAREKPCKHCPASWRFRSCFNANATWISTGPEICTICREFVGLAGNGLCPCFVLKEEAIPKTLKALEEYDERNR